MYSTCSLEPEENEFLIQSFLAEHPEVCRLTPKNEVLKSFLNEFGAVEVIPSKTVLQDGFYAVLLKKR